MTVADFLPSLPAFGLGAFFLVAILLWARAPADG